MYVTALKITKRYSEANISVGGKVQEFGIKTMFVFTFSCLQENSCLIYVIVFVWWCPITCCVMFLFCFSALVNLMLPYSLECPILFTLAVFSNVNLQANSNLDRHNNTMQELITSNKNKSIKQHQSYKQYWSDTRIISNDVYDILLYQLVVQTDRVIQGNVVTVIYQSADTRKQNNLVYSIVN